MDHKQFWISVLCIIILVILVLSVALIICANKTKIGGMDYDDLIPTRSNEILSDEDSTIYGGRRMFKLRMRDPGYTQALDGKKTVELRLNRPPFNQLKSGDKIVVSRSRPPEDTTDYAGIRRFPAKIERVTPYPNIKTLISAEGIEKLSPGTKTEANVIKAYREFISEEDEKSLGLVAIVWIRA